MGMRLPRKRPSLKITTNRMMFYVTWLRNSHRTIRLDQTPSLQSGPSTSVNHRECPVAHSTLEPLSPTAVVSTFNPCRYLTPIQFRYHRAGVECPMIRSPWLKTCKFWTRVAAPRPLPIVESRNSLPEGKDDAQASPSLNFCHRTKPTRTESLSQLNKSE